MTSVIVKSLAGYFLGVCLIVCVHCANITIDVSTTERSQGYLGADFALLYCGYTITPEQQPTSTTSISVDWKRGISLMARIVKGGLSPISESSNTNKYNIINDSSLKISNVEDNDEGTYTCLVTVSPQGEEPISLSSDTRLIVGDPDMTTVDPDSVGGAVYDRVTKYLLLIALTTLFLITAQ